MTASCLAWRGAVHSSHVRTGQHPGPPTSSPRLEPMSGNPYGWVTKSHRDRAVRSTAPARAVDPPSSIAPCRASSSSAPGGTSAGRSPRRATRGLRVVAVDRNADAPGLALADAAEVVDFADVDAVERVARQHAVDGALTVSADRAVPVVAAVTERLGLPSIGTAVAHRMTHKLAMRRTLAEEGIPQPAFAAVRSLAEGRAALEAVGLPAVLKPVDSGGQRGVFRIDSPGDLESNLHVALVESPAREAILEGFVDGIEMNGIVIARDGDARLVTLSDRLRPPGNRLRRRLDPPLSRLDPLGSARARRANRRAGGHGPRPARRDRLPAADRLAGRRHRRGRGRRPHPRRPDGGSRPTRRRRRSRRGRAPARARRGGAGRARAAAVLAAARDPLSHRVAQARCRPAP